MKTTSNSGLNSNHNFLSVYAGNFVDFLEFSLFAALLPIISKTFLPHLEHELGVVLSYFIFCFGFIGRPLGVWIFGKRGDEKGRKNLLILSVSGISLSTAMIAMAPGADSMGYVGAILITVGRLFQGVFTGTEYAAASVYAYEATDPDDRPSKVAYLVASGIWGSVVAQVIAALCFQEGVPPYAWRLIFIVISFLSGSLALLRLKTLVERPLRNVSFQEKSTFSIKNFKREFLLGVCMGAVMNGFFYFIGTFLNTYKPLVASQNMSMAYVLSAFVTSTMALSLVFWAKQKFIAIKPSLESITGALKVLCIAFVFLTFVLKFTPSLAVTLVSQILFVFIMQFFSYQAFVFLPSLFPEEYRIRGSGLSNAVGNSFLGGMSPYISSQFVYLFGFQEASHFYMFGLVLVCIGAANLYGRSFKKVYCGAENS